MIQSCLEQLERWVAGESIHNKERDECCPDFSCCRIMTPTPIEQRKAFLEAYKRGGSEETTPMLGMFLTETLADEGMNVHIAGESPTTH